MPRMGTPDSSSPAGAGGAPGAYTEDGPPDRMIAEGVLGQHLGGGHRGRDDLGVDLALAHPPGDELRVLRPEVHHEDRAGAGGSPRSGPEVG